MMVKVGIRKCFKAGDSWQEKANKKRAVLDSGRPKVKATVTNSTPGMVEVKIFHKAGIVVHRLTRQEALTCAAMAQEKGIKVQMKAIGAQ